MERYITDLKNLDYDKLCNTEWDLIELGFTVDHISLMQWYETIKETMQSSKFNVDEEDEKYLEQSMLRRWKAANSAFYKNRPSHWWFLNWSIERYDPLPFSFLANRQIYPEVLDSNHSDQTNSILSRYRFGAFEELYKRLDRYLLNMRIQVIPEGAGLHLHVDMPYPDVIPRMHMNLNIHENCVWYFGHSAERQYVMEPGKVYLANTAVFHSVINHGGPDWVILYGTPNREDLESLIKIK